MEPKEDPNYKEQADGYGPAGSESENEEQEYEKEGENKEDAKSIFKQR